MMQHFWWDVEQPNVEVICMRIAIMLQVNQIFHIHTIAGRLVQLAAQDNVQIICVTVIRFVKTTVL